MYLGSTTHTQSLEFIIQLWYLSTRLRMIKVNLTQDNLDITISNILGSFFCKVESRKKSTRQLRYHNINILGSFKVE